MSYTGFDNVKLHEVVNYLTRLSFGVAYFSQIWNKEKFNSLPADIQEIIWEQCGYAGSKWYGDAYNDVNQAFGVYEKYSKEPGGHTLGIYDLPKEELERWKNQGGVPVWESWADSMEAEGLPGKAVLERTLELIEEERGKL